MAECGFCGEEFDRESDLRDHIESEHREEAREEITSEGWEKKHLAVKHTLTIIVVVAAGLVIPQVLTEASIADENQTNISIDENPMLGEEDAPVTVIFFGDYKCTSCTGISNYFMTGDFRSEFIDTGRAKLYYVNYDYLNTENGDSSTKAAIAGECVNKQSEEQFWKYHNKIFNDQKEQTEDWASEDYLINTVRDSTTELNYTSFQQCLAEDQTLEQVNKDKRKGIEMNVGQVPSVFVNRENVEDPTPENIGDKVKEVLQQ